MNHFANNGREYLRKYDTPGQGKTKEQYAASMKMLALSYLGIILVLTLLIIWPS